MKSRRSTLDTRSGGRAMRERRDGGAMTAATAAARSAAVSCCEASALHPGAASAVTTRHARSLDGVITRLIYLLLFMAPQVLIYLYLRERLPDPAPPHQARLARVALAAVFIVFNLPWLVVGQRVLFGGSMWGVGRIPFTGPWIAWQLLGWIFCALVSVYILGRAAWRTGGWLLRRPPDRQSVSPPDGLLSRRRFLARATYAYAGAGTALSAYGIWSAYRLPRVTLRTLGFPDLPPGLDGLKLLHLSDLH